MSAKLEKLGPRFYLPQRDILILQNRLIRERAEQQITSPKSNKLGLSNTIKDRREVKGRETVKLVLTASIKFIFGFIIFTPAVK